MKIVKTLLFLFAFSVAPLAHAAGESAEHTAEVYFEPYYNEDLANGISPSFQAKWKVSLDDAQGVYWEREDGCKFRLLITDKDPLTTEDYETIYDWKPCYESDTASILLEPFEGANWSISVGGQDFLETEGTFWAYLEFYNTNPEELYIPPVSASFIIDHDELEEPFSDMDGHWGEGYINALATLDDVHGYADGTFRPDKEITRAELLVIALNAISDPEYGSCAVFDFDQTFTSQTFSDVTSSHWVYPSVELAASMDIISGYADGSFRPDALVTRAEALALLWNTYMVCDYHYLDGYYGDYLWKAYLEQGYDVASEANLDLNFSDIPTENWQRFYAYLSDKHHIAEGYLNSLTGLREFRPNNLITRAEAAKCAWMLRVHPTQNFSFTVHD